MMRKNLWIFSGVVVIVVIAGLLVYGSYISAQYQMESLEMSAHEQWVQLNGALHRWANVAPRLETAMAPVAKQNATVLNTLKSAQQSLEQAHDPQAVMGASQGLDKAFNDAALIAQRNKNLQQDAGFQDIQDQLSRAQLRVAQDIDRYNESLRNYNTFVGNFPNSIWAKIAGFHQNHHFFPEVAGAGKSVAN